MLKSMGKKEMVIEHMRHERRQSNGGVSQREGDRACISKNKVCMSVPYYILQPSLCANLRNKAQNSGDQRSAYAWQVI